MGSPLPTRNANVRHVVPTAGPQLERLVLLLWPSSEILEHLELAQHFESPFQTTSSGERPPRPHSRSDGPTPDQADLFGEVLRISPRTHTNTQRQHNNTQHTTMSNWVGQNWPNHKPFQLLNSFLSVWGGRRGGRGSGEGLG